MPPLLDRLSLTLNAAAAALLLAAASWPSVSGTTAQGVVVENGTTGAISNPAPGVAQGSTTAGQSGTLVMGAVTANAPSYSDTQSSPLSLDINGGLRLRSDYAPAQSLANRFGRLILTSTVTAPPTYANATINPPTTNTVGQMFVTTEGQRTTYRLAAGAHTVFAANTTDVFVVGGSATKTVRLGKLSVCGTATAATTIDVRLIKRSTADTGGTSTAATAVALDSNNAAATSTALTYTVNPTTGTAVGDVDWKKINLGTTGGGSGCLFWQFGDTNGQALTLRGTAQQVALNLNGVTAPAGTNLAYSAEVTEE